MKICCVGAGPAGLYFAILAGGSGNHDVRVFERNPADGADGWGVVFWDDLVDDLQATDAPTSQRVRDAALQWQGQVVDLQGERASHPGSGYGIARAQLLDLLTTRAIELGVQVEHDRPFSDVASLADYDLVVAADGATSALRQLEPERYGTSMVVGRNKYVWLGTPRIFDPFTFAFVNTRAGWIWCHAYAFDSETSTFIVECPPETWSDLGFDQLNRRDALERLEGLFAGALDGAPLKSLNPSDTMLPWLNFRTIRNERWHTGNTVLVGDAAHTTHFSIGSGTRLAIQDAITLAHELRQQPTLTLALTAYESARRDALIRPQTEARFSARWFENVDRYTDLSTASFFALLRARRDPLLPRIPPKLYARIYLAADRVRFLRTFKGWAGPRVRALYGRLRARAR